MMIGMIAMTTAIVACYIIGGLLFCSACVLTVLTINKRKKQVLQQLKEQQERELIIDFPLPVKIGMVLTIGKNINNDANCPNHIEKAKVIAILENNNYVVYMEFNGSEWVQVSKDNVLKSDYNSAVEFAIDYMNKQ